MNAFISAATKASGPLCGLLLAVLGAASLPARAGDVGVSLSFSQPGVYGRVDIGRYPAPMLWAPQPVIVARPVIQEPVYLWVPPGHRRDWRHHCHHYGACGAPVYFVQDGWYRDHVAPHPPYPAERHWRGPDRRDDWREQRRDERWDDRRDGWRDGGRDGWREGPRDHRH